MASSSFSNNNNNGGWYSMFGWSENDNTFGYDDPDVRPSLLSRAKQKSLQVNNNNNNFHNPKGAKGRPPASPNVSAAAKNSNHPSHYWNSSASVHKSASYGTTDDSLSEAREEEVEISPTRVSRLIQTSSTFILADNNHRTNDRSFDSDTLDNVATRTTMMGGDSSSSKNKKKTIFKGSKTIPQWESLDEEDTGGSPTSVLLTKSIQRPQQEQVHNNDESWTYYETSSEPNGPTSSPARKQLFGFAGASSSSPYARSAIESSSSNVTSSHALLAMRQLAARQQQPRPLPEDEEDTKEEEQSLSSSFSLFWGSGPSMESQAQTAFMSPSAMAAKRLGKRTTVKNNKSNGESSSVYSSIPKRYQPSGKSREHRSDFYKYKMKDALQVRSTNANAHGATSSSSAVHLKLPMNKARSKHGGHTDAYGASTAPAASSLLYYFNEEQDMKMLKEIRLRQATKIAVLTQPHVRRCQQRRYYLQMGVATRKIQRVFRQYREDKRQHCLHSEELKQRAAKASRRAHARQREQTVLGQRHRDAAAVIGRALWKHRQRHTAARKQVLDQEHQLAQHAFQAQTREWAAAVLQRSWKWSLRQRQARHDRALLQKQRLKAGRIVLCALQCFCAFLAEQRELRAWAALVVYRVVAQHHAKRVLQRKIGQRQAALVIQRLCKRFHMFFMLERRIIVRRYHRMGHAASILQRSMKRYHHVKVLERRIRDRRVRNRAASIITDAISDYVQRRHHAAFILSCALSAFGQLRNRAARIITRAIAEYTLVRQYSALVITHAMYNFCFKSVLFKRIVARRVCAGQQLAQRQGQASTVIARAFQRHWAKRLAQERALHHHQRNAAASILTRAMARNRFKCIHERNLIRQYIHWAVNVLTRALKHHRFLCVLQRNIDNRRIRAYVHWAARTVTRAFRRNTLRCEMERRMAQRRAQLELDQSARIVTRALIRNRFACVMERNLQQRRLQWAQRTVARALMRNRFQNILERRIHARRLVKAKRVYRGLSQQCALRVLKRRMDRKQMVRKKAAARIIQRNWRPVHIKISAANCIRRAWRCWVLCRALHAKFQEQKAARVKVQAKSRFKAMTRRRTQFVLNRRKKS